MSQGWGEEARGSRDFASALCPQGLRRRGAWGPPSPSPGGPRARAPNVQLGLCSSSQPCLPGAGQRAASDVGPSDQLFIVNVLFRFQSEHLHVGNALENTETYCKQLQSL